ncbi:sigma-54-dependent Fis family transcriptional regulator [Pacificimonas sp. WHA3]|uniref:Sigma-54-dependent Fis family transcriptional regulator n=1 Tax=Pacificimonas pallii TaxID=2827236 RepID=A0ABS6SF19_9SPHN|nr:sigma-54 dependent transcriptional regulator [Pacificimonas pallii]MBV7256987.1 sigma-54-dependent Fis family transcriptional regulator [Pacificimonas pallii]
MAKMSAARLRDNLSKILIGQSAAMRDVRELICRISATDSSCLITGPSGSGKEVVATALHNMSGRSGHAIETLNCGAVPHDLIESELFGHKKGAFTGAIESRSGRFERANGGTLFLDEIGDMPFDMQVKLLRVLETRRYERVGGGKAEHADVRIIAATHTNLEDAITSGKFREDLYYRLNVLPICLPALADRREDIEELVRHFAGQDNHNRFSVGADAIAVLTSYDWPGNVRELRNFCERASVLHAGRTLSGGEAQFLLSLGRAHAMTVDPRPAREIAAPASGANIPVTSARPVAAVHTAKNVVPLLPALAAAPSEASSFLPSPGDDILGDSGVNLRTILADIEQSYIEAALLRSDHVIAEAARLLGLQRTTLCEKMRRYDIARETDIGSHAAKG